MPCKRMIVTERQAGEVIAIGIEIQVTLIDIRRDIVKHVTARIRVEAPNNLRVYHKRLANTKTKKGRVLADAHSKKSNSPVFSRQENQSIMIGDEIEVVIVKIGTDSVEIGVIAKGISIHRQEIHNAILVERYSRQLVPANAG